MRQADIVGEIGEPLINRLPGRLTWILTAASILLVIAAFGISIRAAITSGDYHTLVSHQALTPLVTITYAIIGALVASRHSRNPIGWIFLSVGCLYTLEALAVVLQIYHTAFSQLDELAVWSGNWLWIPAVFLPTAFVFLVFPEGHLPSPRWRFVAWSAVLGLLISVLAVMLHPGPLSIWGMETNPYGIPAAAPTLDVLVNIGAGLLIIGLIGSLAGFSVRFRRSTGIERKQMKWLGYAGGLMLLGFTLSSAAWIIWPENSLVSELTIALTNLTILGMALAATIAILRYRLYEIDLIINRTLVYGALTGGTLCAYILIVGLLGALFQARGNLLVSLLATGLVAVLFQPLRERLQQGVNHLMYGERDDPYAVLSRLGQQLESSLSPDTTLPTVVETIAQALKLPYVAIALKEAGDFRIAASYGLIANETVQLLPLIYQGETVGRLILATRSSNEPFTQAEQRLLEDIAHHVGVAAHAVRLTGELRQLAADLQHSRERLVSTREEERQRLRNDLHDGLGPVLASQGLKLAALQQLTGQDPAAARRLLEQLIAQNEEVVSEIRRLIYDLRPPALDTLGLVEAVRDQVMVACEDSGIQLPVQIQVEEPPSGLPPLPAAVEVAAYRIALEALTNVSRHAQAESCTIRFSVDAASANKTLCLEIRDDGTGLPERYQPGVGLTSMKERAEEVGGQFVVESLQEGGTRILALFPLST